MILPGGKSNVSLWCGRHHSLLSRLFVLAAFLEAAVAAFVGIQSTVALLIALLIAAAAARCPIILRVSSRRVLTSTFAGALLHPLISFSIVCHYLFLR